MPRAAQALDVAMHIRSEPAVDPVALAHEMISLLRSVRTPGGTANARPRQTCRLRAGGGGAERKASGMQIWPVMRGYGSVRPGVRVPPGAPRSRASPAPGRSPFRGDAVAVR